MCLDFIRTCIIEITKDLCKSQYCVLYWNFDVVEQFISLKESLRECLICIYDRGISRRQ
jgi:hypothetical protein